MVSGRGRAVPGIGDHTGGGDFRGRAVSLGFDVAAGVARTGAGRIGTEMDNGHGATRAKVCPVAGIFAVGRAVDGGAGGAGAQVEDPQKSVFARDQAVKITGLPRRAASRTLRGGTAAV